MPQVVIIEAGGSDSTLQTEFSLQYSVSNSSAVLINSTVGKVTVNIPLESSEVSKNKHIPFRSEYFIPHNAGFLEHL